VGLHCQQRAQPGLGVCPCPPVRFEEGGDVGVLAIDQGLEVLRRFRADRQHPQRQVVCQPLLEGSVQQIVEEGHRGSSVQVQQPLLDDGEPVLLVIAHRVHRAQRPGFLLGELDPRRRARFVQAAGEADRAAGLPVENPGGPALYQCGLEQHLEGVLQVQQDGGHPTIVVGAVESRHRRAHRGDRLALKHACFVPQLHPLRMPQIGPRSGG